MEGIALEEIEIETETTEEVTYQGIVVAGSLYNMDKVAVMENHLELVISSVAGGRF